MRKKLIVASTLVTVALTLGGLVLHAQDAAFTYQGQLVLNGSPANGKAFGWQLAKADRR